MTEKSFVEKEGTSSVPVNFRLIALSLLETYYDVAKPGGNEGEAINSIIEALESGHNHQEIRYAIKRYGSTVDDSKFAKPANKFFARDGERFYWQQYVKRSNVDPPPYRGFDESMKIGKRRGS